VEKDPEIRELLACKTIQQGPGEVLVCMKIECLHNLDTKQISSLINNFEKKIRAGRPEIKWLYIEPDFRVNRNEK